MEEDATMVLKPEHDELPGYFNVDNGTGTIRVVYLQGNEMVALRVWTKTPSRCVTTSPTRRSTPGVRSLACTLVTTVRPSTRRS
jgi:carboxypeptidase Q